MRRFLPSILVIVSSLGCSSTTKTNADEDSEGGRSNAGGASGTTSSIGGGRSVGGAVAVSGGAPNTATTPVGGAISSGTAGSSGGSGTAAGGVSNGAGTATGGALAAIGGTATGGATAASGGTAGTGGVMTSGATGGTTMGGATAVSGGTATGGATAASGGTAKGGTTTAGGAVATGGMVSTGGTTGCTGACCADADCPGSCQKCSSSHVCVAVTNSDDPNGRCAGTCDATGTCKGKLGQACTAIAAGCVSGTVCSPEGVCCDKACTGSCEACDVAGAVGTCTTLGSGAPPHTGHAACTATSTECAGTCDGTSNACSYTTASCGSASCSGSTYTPVGTCNKGACAAGTAVACPTNQTCSGSACACVTPNVTCGGTCTDVKTDSANCGSCGHSCGSGGACTAGQCQPIVMASGLGGYSFVFGVDAGYVYYNNCSSTYGCAPLRIALSAIGGSGTVLTTLTTSGIGVIGNTLVLFLSQGGTFLCNVGTTCAATDSTRLNSSGILTGFKSPAPSYFSLNTSSNATTEITTWYTTSNTVQSTFYWSHTGGIGSFAAVGNAVYFSDTESGGSSYSIWGTVGFPASTTRQLAGGITFYPSVVDANANSLIYQNGDTNYLYRVPLPGGLGTAAPQNIVGATGTKFVTEDANGIYWIDSTGNLNRCVAPTCTGSTVMTTGQILGNYWTPNWIKGALYQDSSFLYWINGDGQLMKLAK